MKFFLQHPGSVSRYCAVTTAGVHHFDLSSSAGGRIAARNVASTAAALLSADNPTCVTCGPSTATTIAAAVGYDSGVVVVLHTALPADDSNGEAGADCGASATLATRTARPTDGGDAACTALTWLRDRDCIVVMHASGRVTWIRIVYRADGAAIIGDAVISVRPAQLAGAGPVLTSDFLHAESLLVFASRSATVLMPFPAAATGAEWRPPDMDTAPSQRLKFGSDYVACHPTLSLIACVTRNAGNVGLLFYDATKGRAAVIAERGMRQLSRTDAYCCASWRPSDVDLVLAFSSADERVVRLVRLVPAATMRDDGRAPVTFATVERSVSCSAAALVNIEWFVPRAPPQMVEARDAGGVAEARGGAGYGGACVVGLSLAGELCVKDVQVDARAAWAAPTLQLLALNDTVEIANVEAAGSAAAGGDSAPDAGVRVAQRVAHGFALDAESNANVARSVGDESAAQLFHFISILQNVGPVAPAGPVPGVILLLEGRWGPPMPSVAQLVACEIVSARFGAVIQQQQQQAAASGVSLQRQASSGVGGAAATTAQTNPVFASASVRAILSVVLGWVPKSAAELHQQRAASRDTIERAAAMSMLFGDFAGAAEVLRQFHWLHPSYAAIAALLAVVSDDAAASGGGVGGGAGGGGAGGGGGAQPVAAGGGSAAQRRLEAVLGGSPFFSDLGPWLVAAFGHMTGRSVAYDDPALPLADRFAAAVACIVAPSELARVLAERIRPHVPPLSALVFLLDGVNEGTIPMMQRYVDATGDAQLAACLFARVAAATQSTRVRAKWARWEAAYRRLLEEERLHVRRAQFDLALRQLFVAGTQPQQQAPAQQQQQHRMMMLMTGGGGVGRGECVCGSVHQRPPDSRPPVCSVCAQRVDFQCGGAQPKKRFEPALSWCASCLHGGHHQHLLEWFAKHRKCPVDTCACRCSKSLGMV